MSELIERLRELPPEATVVLPDRDATEQPAVYALGVAEVHEIALAGAT